MENTRKNAKVRIKMKARTATGAENPYARARKQRALFILGVFAMIAAIFLFQIVHAHISSNAVNDKLAVETVRYDKVKDENSDLKNKVKQMNDEDYLEKLVRAKYFYTKKGETVYNLPTDAN
jgi:cell division protein DivIC